MAYSWWPDGQTTSEWPKILSAGEDRKATTPPRRAKPAFVDAARLPDVDAPNIPRDTLLDRAIGQVRPSSR
jgi:hypothetical protein